MDGEVALDRRILAAVTRRGRRPVTHAELLELGATNRHLEEHRGRGVRGVRRLREVAELYAGLRERPAATITRLLRSLGAPNDRGSGSTRPDRTAGGS